MEPTYITIAKELHIRPNQVRAVLDLTENGATVPFMSRYRKEVTGGLNEVDIQNILTVNNRIHELIKRKETILKSIKEQGKLTHELQAQLNNIDNINELEDFYLPYKQKRKTRGLKAKEIGLEPLANIFFQQRCDNIPHEAKRFISKEVPTVEDAISGAKDIIAEWINEDIAIRKKLRVLYAKEATLYSKVNKGKTEEAIKYKDYYDFSEKANKCPSHRLLAIRRGETEGFLRLTIKPDEDKALYIINKNSLKGFSASAKIVKEAAEDAYKRLLYPSLENEIKKSLKEVADNTSIDVFADNLHQLLMASPLGRKRVLAIDPGFRTGCKVVCLDENGGLLYNETIYPNPPQRDQKNAAKKINSLANSYKTEVIAIGNGTASRETEHFIRRSLW
jgi:protein Tex